MNKGSGKTLKCVTLFTRWLRAIIILPRSCDPEGLSSPFPEWKQQFNETGLLDRILHFSPHRLPSFDGRSKNCPVKVHPATTTMMKVSRTWFSKPCVIFSLTVCYKPHGNSDFFFFSPTYQCLWSCWEALNHSGSATSFQYLFSLMFVQCSFVSNFSPRKSELISDSPEPSERLS